MAQTLKHKRSSVVSNGSPKLPTTDQIAVGEIAINFAEGYETLSTRNNNNGIATFSSDSVLDKKYISSGAVVSAISAVTVTLENDEYTIAQAFNEQNDRITSLEEAGFLTDYTETDPTVPSWAKQSTKPTYTAAEVGAMATSERSNYLGTGTTYFDDVEYDSNTKRINFKKNSSVIDYVDATDFIKDGMVSSVTVSNGNLVISFNTDAGREDIELALTQIFNPNNYYDKTAADAKFLSAYTETDPTVVSFAKKSNGFYELGVMGSWPVDPEIEDTYGDKAFPTWHRVTYELKKYALSAHTHTAAEVGAMATSERSNYLPTGTTLDNIADGTTRKLSNYSTTGHTHSQYATTADTANFITSADTPVEIFDIELSNGVDELTENTFTVSTQMYNDMVSAANNGKLPVIRFYTETGNVTLAYFVLRTVNVNGMLVFSGNDPWNLSENGNPVYFTAVALWMEEGSVRHMVLSVQAMTIGERSNYLPTGTTLDNVADGTTRKLSNYSLTSHTHNYLPLSGGDMTGDFYVINPSNDLEHTQFMKNGITFSRDSSTAIHLTPGWLSGTTFGSNLLFLPTKTGMIATLDDIPSADTKVKIYTASGMTSSINGPTIANALPQDFYTSVLSDIANGVLPVVRLSYTDGSNLLLPLQVNAATQENLLFTAVYYNQTYTFTFTNESRSMCDYRTYWLQNEDTLYGNIKRSGFTQSAITAITINGSAATVSSGSASFNIELGGGGSGSGLPTVSASDNGKILQVVDGQWTLVTPTVVYTGNGTPDNVLGNDGDIYLQTS